MSKTVIALPAAPLAGTEWTAVEDHKLVAGEPENTFKVFHASADGNMCAGIWECTPGKWKVSYDEDEFCTLIEGHIRLTNDDGETQEFTAPANFMIPRGFSGTWEAVTNVRKYFVIYEG